MKVKTKLKDLKQLSISKYDWNLKNRGELIRDVYDNGYNVNKGYVKELERFKDKNNKVYLKYSFKVQEKEASTII